MLMPPLKRSGRANLRLGGQAFRLTCRLPPAQPTTMFDGLVEQLSQNQSLEESRPSDLQGSLYRLSESWDPPCRTATILPLTCPRQAGAWFVAVAGSVLQGSFEAVWNIRLRVVTLATKIQHLVPRSRCSFNPGRVPRFNCHRAVQRRT